LVGVSQNAKIDTASSLGNLNAKYAAMKGERVQSKRGEGIHGVVDKAYTHGVEDFLT
jgi:hypothetical protein